jgi:hypothetical protein
MFFRSDRQSNVKGHQGDDIAQLTQFMLHINGQFVVVVADGLADLKTVDNHHGPQWRD